MATYLGDFTTGVAIEYFFNSTDAPGALITLAGTPSLSVYEQNNATEFTTGASLSVDYDGKTGLHKATIDTASGYSIGKDYAVWLAAGTVDGVSQVNMLLFQFSIQNRYTGANVVQWRGSTPAVLADTDKVSVSAQHMADGLITAAKIASGAITSAKFAANALDAVWSTSARTLTSFGTLASDVWSVATRLLTAGTNIVLAKGTGVTGFNDLSAAQVNAEVDTAIVDAALASQASVDVIDGIVDGIAAKTVNLPASPAATGDAMTLTSDYDLAKTAATQASVDATKAVADAIKLITDAITATGSGLSAIPWNAAWDAEVQSEALDALQATVPDSIPADGTRPSVQQGVYMITQMLMEFAISGTTLTVNKPDGTTALMTFTLNDATNPTALTRAS